MALGIIFVDFLLEGLTTTSKPKEWHKALLLPDNYKVVGTKKNTFRGTVSVVVESEAIPEHPSGLTLVVPHYCQVIDDYDDFKAHPELDRIEYESIEVFKPATIEEIESQLAALGIKKVGS